jgi:1-acyl-sn-glycerol-3-phosphate acyltransferase
MATGGPNDAAANGASTSGLDNSGNGGNSGGSGNNSGNGGNGSARAPRAKPPSVLATLLNLPYFVAVVFLMYWSLPFCALFGYIPPWQLWGKRNDIFYWCKFFVDAFRIDARLIEPKGKKDAAAAKEKTPPSLGAGAPLYRGPGPVIYLANHRSWADFFLDAYLTAGRAQMLSRMAVLYAFPWFMLPITVDRGCVVFKRGTIADKDAFNSWLDSKIAASPAPGLVVYPEGHRSSLEHSLPLKRGMLHYAYGRKVPVQVVMSAGKERVLSEKRRRAAWGGIVATAYAPVIHPSDYSDFSSFMAAVQASWDAAWEEARPYAFEEGSRARVEALPKNKVVVDLYRWPPHLQAAQTLFAVAAACAMTLTVWCWCKAALWLTSAAVVVPLRPALLALWLVWVVASFVACRDDGGDGGVSKVVAAEAKKDA